MTLIHNSDIFLRHLMDATWTLCETAANAYTHRIAGLYSVFMKKRIADESQVNMPIFFGFVGIINILVLWPGFLVLHFTGVERFELPSDGRVAAILITNAVGSTISDLSWAYAVLLTSPIVVTVGLSMTIPLSLIGQMILNSQTSSFVYWIGAIIVVLSFVIVNQEEQKDELLGPEQQLSGSKI